MQKMIELVCHILPGDECRIVDLLNARAIKVPPPVASKMAQLSSRSPVPLLRTSPSKVQEVGNWVNSSPLKMSLDSSSGESLRDFARLCKY